MTQTIGTCSICGGAVTVPTIFHSVVPPVPTCSSCGATARASGPVVPMEPRAPVRTVTVGGADVLVNGWPAGMTSRL